ncbi:MAG: AAA family ATPase [Hormoscilla sp. GM7CHS1pb]|nr:AAA family ATPase [Hormoscilla sp. GM7CHS1pb]
MFKQITLKNYRTHKSTTIDIRPVTLLIGNNNSGKTNLLAGIQHFASLLRRSHPQHPKFNQPVSAEDYYPHRYRLAGDDESLSISIVWENHEGKIVYDMLVGIGTLEGEIIDDEVTGKRRVKYQLAELWYSGTIG